MDEWVDELMDAWMDAHTHRPTFIHRLLIRGTVEERLYRLLSSTPEVPNQTKDPQESTLTLTQLHDLFSDVCMENEEEEEEEENEDLKGDSNSGAGEELEEKGVGEGVGKEK